MVLSVFVRMNNKHLLRILGFIVGMCLFFGTLWTASVIIPKMTLSNEVSIPACPMQHFTIVIQGHNIQQTILNDEYFVFGDTLKIGLKELPPSNWCARYEVLTINDINFSDLESSKLDTYSTDESKINNYTTKNKFYFVENPYSQLEMKGDIEGKASGSSSGSYCGFIFCGHTYSNLNLDLSGNIKLTGQLSTPTSVINESDFMELVYANSDEFVKCFNAPMNNIVNTDGKPLTKFMCGIEKNNLLVISEIREVEKETKSCRNMTLEIQRFLDPYYVTEKRIDFVPSAICSDIWEMKI